MRLVKVTEVLIKSFKTNFKLLHFNRGSNFSNSIKNDNTVAN